MRRWREARARATVLDAPDVMPTYVPSTLHSDHQRHTCHDEGLLLRPVTSGDAPALLETVDHEVAHWQGYDADAIAAIRSQLVSLPYWERRWPRMRRVLCCQWFVVCEPGGLVLGQYSFAREVWTEHPTLGWWLGPHGRGRGLGTRSLGLALDYAHQHLGLVSVCMVTDGRNVRARRQIEGNGGVLVGEREVELPNGTRAAGVVYRHDAAPSAPGSPTSRWASPCASTG